MRHCLLSLTLMALALDRPAEAAAPTFALEGARPVASAPLDKLTVVGARGAIVSILDGQGHEYARLKAGPRVTFTVGGALGTQTVRVLDAAGKVKDSLTFTVDAETRIDDQDGRYADLLAISRATMRPEGGGKSVWRGRTYHHFVSWVLDNANNTKGQMYFSPYAAEGVDLWRESQKADGMIWSFVEPDRGPGHYDTAYGKLGYTLHDGGILFVRQPNENHVEYEYVNMLYLAWKSSGDDAWMARSLDSAIRALNYGVTDRVRFSQRFKLLKRPYTIDSWDFQVDDQYTPKARTVPTMTIDPDKTKFGVFFGDNTGYMAACQRLAEMLERAGRAGEAETFHQRLAEIRERLDKLAWNGRFFRHFLDEDPTVKRNLGVDEAAQIAQGNAYSLNRPISHEQAVAIINTYMDLKKKLPKGSPGEWYAIYPPFERGFGPHGGKWQYMNGGVAGHAAGELARGSFEHGYEGYAVSVLDRMLELGRKYDRKIYFAYTGAFEDPPPPQTFAPLDLSGVANMDLRDQGAAGVPGWMGGEKGNDMRVPTGAIKAADVPWQITDPARNGRRAALGLSLQPGYAKEIEVPVGRHAGAVYLLHTQEKDGGEGVAGVVTFRYDDGSEQAHYIRRGKHLSGWWYPALTPERTGRNSDRPAPPLDAGIAWRGPNGISSDVGLSWAMLPNPEPKKRIKSLLFRAPLDNGIYAVVGVTLADKPPYHKPAGVSYGGPDNWAAANLTAALVEGLAGIVDSDRAFNKVRLSPRWTAANVNGATVIVRYAASKGYVAYRWDHEPGKRTIALTVTGNAQDARLRVLLPAGSTSAKGTLDGKAAATAVATVETSRYAELAVPEGVHQVRIAY